VWPETDAEAVDESLCYHARQYIKANETYNPEILQPVLAPLERAYAPTKVVWAGWPTDFRKFVLKKIEWQASPGWPWKKHYPTNKDLFLFDGITVDPGRVAMVEEAVRRRWNELLDMPTADPIFLFVKPEPHKISKADKRSWRLISGVGITDTMIDRILFGDWLDNCIAKWQQIPSKAGWAPQMGGFKWITKAFRGREPMSIDKSSWDWTVQGWHVDVIRELIPRMIFGTTPEWQRVFDNRISALYHPGVPRFKTTCGCEFIQLVKGIQKSGMLGTIGFNSIWQFADHLAIGGDEDNIFFSLGDDTAQERLDFTDLYLENLKLTGAIVKEVDYGFPMKFGGHDMTERSSRPSYRAKHAFTLHYLERKVEAETMDSYRHLYAMDDEFSEYLEKQALSMFGPSGLLSRKYLRDWYLALE